MDEKRFLKLELKVAKIEGLVASNFLVNTIAIVIMLKHVGVF